MTLVCSEQAVASREFGGSQLHRTRRSGTIPLADGAPGGQRSGIVQPQEAEGHRARGHRPLHLSDDDHGLTEEREAVFRLEDRLEHLIQTHQVGEFDGNEFGGGEAVLYCYGPDADRLFVVIEQELRSFTARPAYAILRYGDVTDPSAMQRRIDL